MLTNKTEVPIRFSEVDSLRVVWHGHYVKFFEDGREAFGREHGLTYLDVYDADGLAVPIVDVQAQYKRPLEYSDSAIIETVFVNSAAAKIIFNFKIYSAKHGYLACEGQTTQVFMNPVTKELYITNPPYFEAWKKRMGLL
ncbi:MAG: acyl-CoA thioesterase [Bacteroidia bacterium]|nr:acyl-CoA thioesterase [Bacteroidia bacterium]